MDEATNGLVTPKQAEAMLPFSAQTIKKMCEEGELRAVRIRRRWFIEPESIEELKASGANYKGA